MCYNELDVAYLQSYSLVIMTGLCLLSCVIMNWMVHSCGCVIMNWKVQSYRSVIMTGWCFITGAL